MELFNSPQQGNMSDEMNLWCWVQGDELDRVFPVSIKHSATIGHLKKAIRAEKPSFEHIPADSLKLFKVSEWYR
jgi:hypothetical protein